MAKYFNTKEELHNHYFEIFKDIVEAIANTDHVEDLNTLAIMFDKNTYIPFGRVMGDDIEEFENTHDHHLASMFDERFEITKNAMCKFKNIKTFVGKKDHNIYAYIVIPPIGINTDQLHDAEISTNELAIIETKEPTWYLVEEFLKCNEEELNPFVLAGFTFIDSIAHCSHKFTMACKDTIDKSLAEYGCISDDNYHGLMTINSRYYDIENTKLDFPKSANNEEKFKRIIDYLNNSIYVPNKENAYTQIYFTFFDESKEKALYCKNLISNTNKYNDEIQNALDMLHEEKVEFIKVFEIKYNAFESE